MVWRGVPKVLLPEGIGWDVYPRVQVNRRAVSKCTLCASVLLYSRDQCWLHWAGAALPTPVHGHTGSIGVTALCVLC